MKHPMLLSKTQAFIKKCLLALCVMSGIASIFFISRYFYTKNSLVKTAEALSVKTTQDAAQKISEKMGRLISLVDNLASQISSGTVSLDKIIEHIQEKPSDIHGLGVKFVPYAYNKETILYAPYNVDNDTQKTPSVKTISDYAQSPEFKESLQKKYFRNPFLDTISNNTVIEYSAPFYDKKNNPIGIVYANYSLNDMRNSVATLFPNELGYGAILTNKGILVSHPHNEYVEDKKTGPQIAREFNDFDLASKVEKSLTQSHSIIKHKNYASGEISWSIFELIPQTPWYLLGVFVVVATIPASSDLGHQSVHFFISLILFLIFLLSFSCGAYRGSPRKLWLGSTVVSLGFLMVTIFLWHKALTNDPFDKTDQLTKKDSLSVQNIIKKFNPKIMPAHKNESPENSQELIKDYTYILVPTGLYINNLVLNLDSITIIGNIWLQYPIISPAEITPKIFFPQAKSITQEQAYTFNDRNTQTTGWAFRCELQQNFNYRNYPFDFKHIRIQLWPASTENNTILIPDLDGYQVINPTSLPGLNRKINLQSWQLHESYFSFQHPNYLTNFGYHSVDTYIINNQPPKMQLPELYFNVIASRHLLSSLILNLTPIIIILALLFILLFMTGITSLTFAQMFGSLASLFFTALIAYTAFKTYLPVQQLVFFDYMYFILEAIILAISIIAIIYYRETNIKFIHYKHMLIPQLLFWPITTGAILLVSLIFFY